jgi:hypothetical protein
MVWKNDENEPEQLRLLFPTFRETNKALAFVSKKALDEKGG